MKKLKSIVTATALAVACMELLGCGREYKAMPDGYQILTDGHRYKWESPDGVSVSDFGSTNSVIYWANKCQEAKEKQAAYDAKWHSTK